MLSEEMGFPDTLPSKIEAIWEGYLKFSAERGMAVAPMEFVQKFVDENFSDIDPDIRLT